MCWHEAGEANRLRQGTEFNSLERGVPEAFYRRMHGLSLSACSYPTHPWGPQKPPLIVCLVLLFKSSFSGILVNFSCGNILTPINYKSFENRSSVLCCFLVPLAAYTSYLDVQEILNKSWVIISLYCMAQAWQLWLWPPGGSKLYLSVQSSLLMYYAFLSRQVWLPRCLVGCVLGFPGPSGGRKVNLRWGRFYVTSFQQHFILPYFSASSSSRAA